MSGAAVAVPAVAFEDAGFSYAGAEEGAVRHVTLSVPRGQCVVLTGASGCGKTTLARMVNGLIPSVYAGEQTGRVLVDGVPMERWEMDALCRRVGSVFQNPRSQFFNLDTTSEIAFGCENVGLPRTEIRERVAATAAELGIEALLDRDLRALSGGQKQLVALASVHAMGPDVFVLDEPTASLDVAAMRQLACVMARLKAAGKTVIVAEHRLWWLEGTADRVVLMERGQVVGDWTAEEFGAISAAERAARGLRAWRVGEIEAEASRERGVAGAGTGPAPAQARTLPLPETPSWRPHPSAVAAHGLRAGYGRGADVLRELDLTLEPGSIAALVGRNGAGKTTLARCLAGLHRERAGTVELAGSPVKYRARAGRVYLVMQETGYQLFADSVVREVAEAGEQAAQALLERFDLDALADRHPLSLSGGQRQRLAIAAGVAQGARVLVLDEPTSGLDLGNMRRVAAELAHLRDEGACILVITHDYEFLCASCDVVVELDGGAVAATYALDDASMPRVRKLFGFGPPAENRERRGQRE